MTDFTRWWARSPLSLFDSWNELATVSLSGWKEARVLSMHMSWAMTERGLPESISECSRTRVGEVIETLESGSRPNELSRSKSQIFFLFDYTV